MHLNLVMHKTIVLDKNSDNFRQYVKFIKFFLNQLKPVSDKELDIDNEFNSGCTV